MNNFEKELPSDYQVAMVIDNKDKKVERKMIFGNLLIMVLTMAILLLIHPIEWRITLLGDFNDYYLYFVATMFGYIVLHELLHGIAYWLMTHQKLTFGLTLTVAYCGVPDIYVSRKTALISLFAPLSVFTVVFGLALIFSGSDIIYLIASFMMALHLGGCVGDITVIALLLGRYKEESVLLRDTGPKQTIYVKK